MSIGGMTVNSNFYALLDRMKHIDRWGLMRNTRRETLSEHCLQTAFIAQALVLLHNRRFGGALNPEHAAVLAMYHDASEILTGDMPTPVKYFSPEIRQAYRTAEDAACQKLIDCLPEDLREDMAPYLLGGEEAYRPFVKAADKLSALAKCLEEEQMGNGEFRDARAATEAAVHALGLPEAEVFLEAFMSGYGETLDGLTGRSGNSDKTNG